MGGVQEVSLKCRILSEMKVGERPVALACSVSLTSKKVFLSPGCMLDKLFRLKSIFRTSKLRARLSTGQLRQPLN